MPILSLKALVLEDITNNKGGSSKFENKKICYYLGSFDPLHKGHEHIAKDITEKGLCDYVLAYPAWGGDEYKNRIDINFRLEMLFAVFASHPEVIVTKLSPIKLQETLTRPDVIKTKKDRFFVKPKIKGLEFMSGMYINKIFHQHTKGALLALPVHSFNILLLLH